MDAKEFNDCLDKIRNGNKAALEEIYTAYSGLIYNTAIWVLGNPHDANDVMQDFFKYILENIHEQKHIENPRGWIVVAIRRNAVRFLEQNSKTGQLFDFALEQKFSKRSDVDLGILISESKQSLTDIENEIFEFHYIHGYKGREIAKMINRPHGTIRRDFKKIREKLKHLKDFL